VANDENVNGKIKPTENIGGALLYFADVLVMLLTGDACVVVMLLAGNAGQHDL
jgi:hypothetical protein